MIGETLLKYIYVMIFFKLFKNFYNVGISSTLTLSCIVTCSLRWRHNITVLYLD